MLCPPHDAALPGITSPAIGGCVGTPRIRYSWFILQGQGKRDPMLRGAGGRMQGTAPCAGCSLGSQPCLGEALHPKLSLPLCLCPAAPELSALHEAIEDTVTAVREPVASHSSHCTDEDGGEDHVTLGSQRGEGTDHHTKEHLLQHHHLIISHVIKEALFWGICMDNTRGRA